MVFLGSIQTGQRFSSTGSRSSVGQLAMLVLAVVCIHVLALVVGLAIARRLRFARQDQIAVGFAGSQKTLMVGLQVSLDLGFNIIPILSYHVSQLLVDTVIADRLRRGHEPQAASGGPECKMKKCYENCESAGIRPPPIIRQPPAE
jgi:sodium/bile acid cotransporter 7